MSFAQTFTPLAGGGNHAEHIEAARLLGVDIPEDETPTCPPEAVYLFHWFQELSQQRGQGMSGPLPLAWADIAAWAALSGRRLTRFEIRVLTLLDRLFRAAANEAAERERRKTA